jgi:uncharacterized membrane protein (UPF0127 family)
MRKLLILPLLLLLAACQTESQNSSDSQKPLKQVELITPSNESIQTTLAISHKDQEQGLSGVKPEDFSEDQGLLFFYLQEDLKHFWMPDTYFDLDLFYLDKDLKIIDIIRKLPFYVGRAHPNLIPRARSIWCRHVLEMKASSKISQKLKIGDVLKWQGKYSLSETEAQAKEKYSH